MTELNPLQPLFDGFVKWASQFGMTGDEFKKRAPQYYAGYWKFKQIAEEAYVQRNRKGCEEALKKCMAYWKAGMKFIKEGK